MGSGNVMGMIGMLIGSLPLAVAMLVGLVLAVSRHGRHPRVSLYAAIGFAIGLLLVVAGLGFNAWIQNAASNGDGMSNLSTMMIGFNSVRAVLSLASWGFIIAAIFIDRPAPPRA